MMDNKGYTLSALAPAAIVFVVLTIVVSTGAIILTEMNNTVTNTNAQDILGKGLDALGQFGNWFSVLVIIVVAALVIGMVMNYFGGGIRGGA